MKASNTNCYFCNIAIYKKPSIIKKGNVFCSKLCFNKHKGSLEEKQCLFCGIHFKPIKISSKFCCRVCSNSGRKGLKYSKESQGNKSKKRLEILKTTFNIKCCMIHGCNYERFFEIHRFIHGKNGGKYEIGNMFAICPNHHREIHNKTIIVEKISDCELKIIKDNWNLM